MENTQTQETTTTTTTTLASPNPPQPPPPPPNITPIPLNSNTPLFTPTPTANPEPLRSIPLPFDSSVITSFSLSRPNDYPNSLFNGSASSIKPLGFSMVTSTDPIKRKRGRPRKYSGPEGGVILALSPLSSAPAPTSATAAAAAAPISKNGPNESSYKPKSRSRPVGLGKKQQLNAIYSPGRGFTAHIIVVKAGEDIASKILAFSQQGPQTVCILSANGAVSNVTLRQPATYGGTVSYEGRFEIISLSGSFLLTETGGTRSRTGGMSVSLAGADGRVLGGGVAGMLIAAAPVQVVIGSFSAEENHIKPEQPTRVPLPTTTPYMMGFGMPVAAASPPFRSAYSESSDETGSPIDWNSRACDDTEQSNPGAFTYSSIGHGSTQSSNPHRQDPYKFQ